MTLKIILDYADLNKAEGTRVHCLELPSGGVGTVGEPGLL